MSLKGHIESLLGMLTSCRQTGRVISSSKSLLNNKINTIQASIEIIIIKKGSTACLFYFSSSLSS